MASGSTSRGTSASTRCRSPAAIRSGSRPSAFRCRLRPKAREEPAERLKMLVDITEARAHRVELEVRRAHRAKALGRARQLVIGHARTRSALQTDTRGIAARTLHPLPELGGAGGALVRRREVREEPIREPRHAPARGLAVGTHPKAARPLDRERLEAGAIHVVPFPI